MTHNVSNGALWPVLKPKAQISLRINPRIDCACSIGWLAFGQRSPWSECAYCAKADSDQGLHCLLIQEMPFSLDESYMGNRKNTPFIHTNMFLNNIEARYVWHYRRDFSACFFCHYLLLISLGTSGGLCFAIMAFPSVIDSSFFFFFTEFC